MLAPPPGEFGTVAGKLANSLQVLAAPAVLSHQTEDFDGGNAGDRTVRFEQSVQLFSYLGLAGRFDNLIPHILFEDGSLVGVVLGQRFDQLDQPLGASTANAALDSGPAERLLSCGHGRHFGQGLDASRGAGRSQEIDRIVVHHAGQIFITGDVTQQGSVRS